MEKDKIKVVQGDITKISVDAVVNAANSSLMGGGGVDGAIHRTGGPAILEACRNIVAKQGGCPTGEAVITTAGDLPSRFVIHTVGPVWHGGRQGERDKLASCYQRSLQLAVENDCSSVAFPNISTGVYGFPKSDAAEIAFRSVFDYLNQNVSDLSVTFVCYDAENYNLYEKLLR